jgi:hypothetical protein
VSTSIPQPGGHASECHDSKSRFGLHFYAATVEGLCCLPVGPPTQVGRSAIGPGGASPGPEQSSAASAGFGGLVARSRLSALSGINQQSKVETSHEAADPAVRSRCLPSGAPPCSVCRRRRDRGGAYSRGPRPRRRAAAIADRRHRAGCARTATGAARRSGRSGAPARVRGMDGPLRHLRTRSRPDFMLQHRHSVPAPGSGMRAQ